jgi:hypothetical protein
MKAAKALLVLVSAFLLHGCGKNVMEADELFANDLVEEYFPPGIRFEKAAEVFQRYDRGLTHFQNP